MTVEEFRALPPDERRAAWEALPEAERRQLSVDLLASTPNYGIPYPSNYGDPADSPAAFQAQATTIDGLFAWLVGDVAAKYTKGPTAQRTADWNTALESGFWTSDLGAANRPSSGNDNVWLGLVARYDGDHVTQMAWPIGGGPVPLDTIHQRTLNGGAWNGWARLSNWSHSWGALDNFIIHKHGPGAGVSRFATGMKKDTFSTNPTNGDLWRVQCYDTSGGYLWTAIEVAESGIVYFPKGHTTLLERITSGEPIPADTPLTIGAFAAMLDRVLGQPGTAALLNLTEPEES